MGIDEEFTFGRYAGTTPRELLHNNKGLYLMWCLENVKGFHLEPASLEQGVRNQYAKQYIAVYKKKK
jgi:hypothetical protein